MYTFKLVIKILGCGASLSVVYNEGICVDMVVKCLWAGHIMWMLGKESMSCVGNISTLQQYYILTCLRS
jgi:hypothetical protein